MTIGNQLTLPGLKTHFSHNRKSVGMAGEIAIALALQERGYPVAANHKWGDLQVWTKDMKKTAYIEVKTARRGKDGFYNFTLRKDGCTDHRNADLIILVCLLKTGDAIPFVVPVTVLYEQKKCSITSDPWNYKGKLSPYRQNLKTLSLEKPLAELGDFFDYIP